MPLSFLVVRLKITWASLILAFVFLLWKQEQLALVVVSSAIGIELAFDVITSHHAFSLEIDKVLCTTSALPQIEKTPVREPFLGPIYMVIDRAVVSPACVVLDDRDEVIELLNALSKIQQRRIPHLEDSDGTELPLRIT